MEDPFPANTHIPAVVVNIQHMLEGIDHDLLRIGAWINVMGYVQSLPESWNGEGHPMPKKQIKLKITFVQASMVWSAGAINYAHYVDAVEDYLSSPLTQ